MARLGRASATGRQEPRLEWRRSMQESELRRAWTDPPHSTQRTTPTPQPSPRLALFASADPRAHASASRHEPWLTSSLCEASDSNAALSFDVMVNEGLWPFPDVDALRKVQKQKFDARNRATSVKSIVHSRMRAVFCCGEDGACYRRAAVCPLGTFSMRVRSRQRVPRSRLRGRRQGRPDPPIPRGSARSDRPAPTWWRCASVRSRTGWRGFHSHPMMHRCRTM